VARVRTRGTRAGGAWAPKDEDRTIAGSDASDTLVGRAVPLDVLEREWGRAAAGEPRLVLVGGPAGIGKTALARHFLRSRAAPSLLASTCDELEVNVPLAAIDQLTRPPRGSPASRPTPAIRGAASPADSALDPLTAGGRLLTRIGAYEGDDPLVILLDDAHWADVPSLQALTFTFRRLQAERVLGLVLHRDARLTDGLWRLACSERGRVVRLPGLNADDLLDLGDHLGVGRMSRRSALRLVTHTEGNPLYATALLQEFGADAFAGLTGPPPAPRAFRVTTLGRLADAPASAQALVTAVAVLGQRARLADAAAVAALDRPVHALDAAVAARLLEPVDVAAELVRFPHPLVRAAIYADLRPARRSELHLRAAERLTGVLALDHRVAATLGEDAALTGAVVEQARREAEVGAFSAAAAHLDDARRLAPDPRLRRRLELEAIELLLRAGDVGAARERIATLPPDGADARRAAVTGHLALLTGSLAEAERDLTRAWQLADADRDAEVTARAAAPLAHLVLTQGRGDDAARWAERASTAATDEFTRGFAEGVHMSALAIRGRTAEALDLVADLDGPADGPGLRAASPELTPRDLERLMARGLVRLWAGPLDEARADLVAVIGRGVASQPVRLGAIALAHLALAEFHLGTWDDSVAHAELAVSLATDADYLWLWPVTHYVASLALSGRGQWAAARAHAVASAEGAALMCGDVSAVGYAGTAAAWLATCRREPDQVVDAVDAIAALPFRDGIDEPGVVGWAPLAADALVTLGRLDDAAAMLTPYLRAAHDRGHAFAVGDAERVRGLLLAASGDRAGAGAAFDAASEALSQTSAGFAEAQVDLAYGQTLRRQGQRRRAGALLERARERFHHLAAEPFVAACDLHLSAMGRTPSPRGPQRRLRLTPRELAVARLVARGHTNRETARTLVITEKTVEHHLANIYGKLGVRSRTELAARFPFPSAG
jgi:ATP/maltotriose-dependent transcriptional regulator MalT